jgi:hypothetical protein
MAEPGQFEAEAPETRPFFAGDDWDELREDQYWNRYQTRAGIADRIVKAYLRAAVATGREDDAIALALRSGAPDATPLMLAFAHLAAYWRYAHAHAAFRERFYDPDRDWIVWERWILDEVAAWLLDCPRLLRLAVILLVRPPPVQPPVQPLLAEAEMWELLQRRYPLPPPEQPDLLGDPRW